VAGLAVVLVGTQVALVVVAREVQVQEILTQLHLMVPVPVGVVKPVIQHQPVLEAPEVVGDKGESLQITTLEAEVVVVEVTLQARQPLEGQVVRVPRLRITVYL